MTKIESPNYTQVPNAILGDILPGNIVSAGLMAKLEGSQLKVLLAVCRLTFGFHQTERRASLSMMEKLTGLSRQGILNAAGKLEEYGLIERSKDGGVTLWKVTVYSVDQPYGKAVVNSVDQGVNSVDQGSQLSRPPSKKETEKKPIKNEAAKNAPAPFESFFPVKPPNGRSNESDSLLAQVQSGDPDKIARAQLAALGLGAKAQIPTDGLDRIDHAGWNIPSDRIKQGVAVFLEATPLSVPVSRSERKQWLKGIKDHLEEFGLSGLKELYHTAWNEYLPGITAGKLDITHPLALTRKMRGIRSRPQPTTQEAKYFIDPDTGERIKW